MKKQLLRLALGLLAVAAVARPSTASASTACYSMITDGQMACHLVSGTDCHYCTYHCDDGKNYTYNVCSLQY